MIRKIIVGPNPKDAMAYVVGMRAGTGEVDSIVRDDAALYKYGRTIFRIYIKNDDGVMEWKSIENMPVMLEYDLNF
jgi:hypothetical protein